MAVTPVNYTAKAPNIQVVQVPFDTPGMEEVRDWLIGELGTDGQVTLSTMMGTKLVFTTTLNGRTANRIAYPGQFIIKDAGSKMFVLDTETLDTFFDLAV